MKRGYGLFLLLALISLAVFIPQTNAQIDHIAIAAGSDEDHALQAISNEPDQQKRLAMYEEFVQKFASVPAAVAYGNWQISQAYQTAGDLEKALDYGDKALTGSPRNLDILVSQANIAQQARNNAKLLDYAVKGGELCHSITKQPKPEGMSDEDYARMVAEQKVSSQSNCEFMETAAVNVISTENDPKTRMAYVDKFNEAFPDSKFQETVASLALDALSEMKDNARLVAYGEKILAANPNSLPALLLLANFYSEDAKPGSAAKAISYSQKAIEVANANAPDADKSRKMSAGVAHNTLGWAYLKEEKTAAAVPELKAASDLLKGQDDQQYAKALYGLGFAYGKLNKLAEARDVLTEAVKIPGPLQAMSQDLLNKLGAAHTKAK